jgi:RNA polymerase sigma factor (TIGR02999 family)
MSEATTLPDALASGKEGDAAELLPMVYDELRRLAASYMVRESSCYTLQPTALVHEAWLRLAGGTEWKAKDRAYFFAAAAQAMRRILVEHARRKSALRHGGGKERVDIEGLELAEAVPDERCLLIDEALAQLEKEYPERARVVVLKYFGGMTNREVAEALGTSERTINRHWLCAKTWLSQEIHARE